MSLGYQTGKSWEPDDRYAKYTEWDAYKALIRACRTAGFTFDCRYSYTARRYTAEIVTFERFAEGQYYRIPHANSSHENPMQAIVYVIRRAENFTPLLQACCIEIETLLMREKLLPFHQLGKAIDSLCDTIEATL